MHSMRAQVLREGRAFLCFLVRGQAIKELGYVMEMYPRSLGGGCATPRIRAVELAPMSMNMVQ